MIELGRQNRPHLYRLCESRARSRSSPRSCASAPPSGSAPRARCARSSSRTRPRARRAVAAAAPEAVAVALLHSYRRLLATSGCSARALAASAARRRRCRCRASWSGRSASTSGPRRRRSTRRSRRRSPPTSRGCAREAEAAGLAEPQIMQSSRRPDRRRAGGRARRADRALRARRRRRRGAAARRGSPASPTSSCFDMGGTSCDVCLIEPDSVPETAERVIAGRPVALPALDIHTVGAGGGSIAWRDAGGALRVGPASAGAEPGPACYGRGGERPTVTDANLLLGRLLADAPLAGGVALDRGGRRARGRRARGAQLGLEPLACAEGIVRVAEAEMLGGAAPDDGRAGHRPALVRADALRRRRAAARRGARRGLGISTRAVSARLRRALRARPRGLGAAARRGADGDAERRASSTAPSVWSASARAADAPPPGGRWRPARRASRRATSCATAASPSSCRSTKTRRRRRPGPAAAELREAFDAAHEARYGYRDEQAEIELVNLRASVWGPAPPLADPRAGGARRTRGASARSSSAATGLQAAVLRGEPRRAADAGRPGALSRCPSRRCSCRPAGRRRSTRTGTIVLSRAKDSQRCLDPIELQVLTGALRAACEEMGVVLIRSAHSSNIKERRDASTGLFDADGQMVMQAEHIPVHLGAMPAAVRAVLGERHAAGRLVDPQRPVRRRHPPARHHRDHARLRGASADRLRSQPRPPRRRRRAPPGLDAGRQPHARGGGRRDRAAPADARRRSTSSPRAMRQPRERARRPARPARRQPRRRRAPRECAARARRRAPARGDRRGARLLRAAHARLPGRARRTACTRRATCSRRRDGDLELRLRAEVRGERCVLDFAGSAAQHAGNLNCPLAVTDSACLFAVRVLTDPDIPPTAGAYRPIEVRAPAGQRAERPAAARRSRPATSRPPRASRTWC